MSKITKVLGREIIDSRGNPTVEAEIHLMDGSYGIASVPSGASVGKKEALELRDKDISRFFGNGVMKSVNIINNTISKCLVGKNSDNQFELDKIMIELDGTENKSQLGANSILAVSLAIAKSESVSRKKQLYEYIAELSGTPNKFSIPTPMINIINGGKHANNNLDFQEFMIQPTGSKTIKDSIRLGSEIFQILGKILKSKNMSTSVGDEGGYAPNLHSNEEALSLIKEAIGMSKYKLGIDVNIAIDCASSQFFDCISKKYHIKGEEKSFSSKAFTHYLEKLVKQYSISSIEDGLYEDDITGYIYHTKILGKTVQLVGDDLFVTNPKLLKIGIEKKIANAILIKFNQIGSLTETLETIKLAKKSGYSTIISHRSGETEDTTISDLAVGTSSGQIKTGSMSRSERTAKYNRLIRIEERLESINDI